MEVFVWCSNGESEVFLTDITSLRGIYKEIVVIFESCGLEEYIVTVDSFEEADRRILMRAIRKMSNSQIGEEDIFCHCTGFTLLQASGKKLTP